MNPLPSNTFPCSKFGPTGLFSKVTWIQYTPQACGITMLRVKVYVFLCECIPLSSVWNCEPADRLERTLYSPYTIGAHTGNSRNFSRSTTSNKTNIANPQTCEVGGNHTNSAFCSERNQPTAIVVFCRVIYFWYTDLHKFTGALKCCLTWAMDSIGLVGILKEYYGEQY